MFDHTAANSPARDALAERYNDVPYTSMPDPARHPDRLATIGTLFGLDVAPIGTCRVLEFACGDGANLVPIAATLPDAALVGFDFASRPIARAQAMTRELGLANLRLLELDLRALPGDLGTFDYILAHGLYSWVPADVRECVLPLVARHLAPNGVALVSYNALPGCHVRRIVWDMLAYHTHRMADQRTKLAAARSLLDLVATPAGNDDETQKMLRAQVRNAATGSEASLAHDELSAHNHPVYFHEFAADAARAGLAFLAEARLDRPADDCLAPEVRTALEPLDRLAREQYLDFIRFRHFRESLLCHAGAVTRFALEPARVLGLHALPSGAVRRAAASGALTPESDPRIAAIMQMLRAHWPRSVPVPALHESLAHTAPGVRGVASRPVEVLVTELHRKGMVDLRSAPVRVAAVPGERPEAFAAARRLSHERDIIPSLYHEALRYQDPLGRQLLALLDGTRTCEELAATLGGPFDGADGRARLNGALKVLASKALLVG